MNNKIVSCKKSIRFLNLIKKIFQNSNTDKKHLLNKYRKIFSLILYNKIKNMMKNLYKVDICFLYKILIIGLKLNPILTNIKIKFSQVILKTISIQMFIIIKFFQNKNLNKASVLLRFYFSKIKNIKHKIRFHTHSISKLPEIFFEETADEIKFIFNTNFIQIFLSLNLALGGCLLVLKSSFFKILNFWKIYVNSCYNLMTRCNKIFEVKQYKDDNNISIINNNEKKLDFEIFYLKKIKFTNFYFKMINNPQNYSYDFNYDKCFSSFKYCGLKWRNRHLNKFFFCKKNSVNSIIKKRFILFIH